MAENVVATISYGRSVKSKLSSFDCSVDACWRIARLEVNFGRHAGSEKVSGLSVGISRLPARTTGDSKRRAKARYFLVAAKRRSAFSARAFKESSSYPGVRNTMSKKGWNPFRDVS